MCLAIPAQVIKFIQDDLALVDFGKKVQREVSIALMPGELEIGDWILVHTGYAMSKIEPEEAHETLAMWEEIWKLEREEKFHTSEN